MNELDYIRSEFAQVPEVVLRYEQIAKAKPIPPHHVTPEIGKLLQVLVQTAQAKHILEIGTMWGYSTWWLAQGLQPGGKIITLEKELKHYNLAREFFKEVNLTDQVELHSCDALKFIPTLLNQQFDLIFIDADRREYVEFLKLIEPVLKPGGLLIADNILWSEKWKGYTEQFNHELATSQAWTAVPLNVHSGVMLAVKC